MDNIISILIAERDKLNVERDKLNKAIEALSSVKTIEPTVIRARWSRKREPFAPAVIPAASRTRKPWSAAQKTAAAKRMKAYWAKKHKAA